MEIKLLHLYYDIMNLYGEYGNIKILEEHLKDQGYTVMVDKKTLGEEKNLEEYDFIYMGCGTERNQMWIMQDFKKEKEKLSKLIEQEKNIMLTGNSYEILGKKLNREDALGIFNFEAKNTQKRTTEDVICTSNLLKNKVVGFINNMSEITNLENSLFDIEWGIEDKKEGISYKNLIGTHIIGPILIRNPELLKLLINRICTQKDENFKYKDITYEDEEEGYELVLKELETRKNKNDRR